MSAVVPNRCVVVTEYGSVSHMNEPEIRTDERRRIADWLIRQADDHMATARRHGPDSFSDEVAAAELYHVARRLSNGPVGEERCVHCGAESGVTNECKPCLRRMMGMRT